MILWVLLCVSSHQHQLRTSRQNKVMLTNRTREPCWYTACLYKHGNKNLGVWMNHAVKQRFITGAISLPEEPILHGHTSTLELLGSNGQSQKYGCTPTLTQHHTDCFVHTIVLANLQVFVQPSIYFFQDKMNSHRFKFTGSAVDWAAGSFTAQPQPSVNIAVNKNKLCHTGASLLGLKAKFSYWCLTSIHHPNRRLLYWPQRATEWQSPFLIDNITGW